MASVGILFDENGIIVRGGRTQVGNTTYQEVGTILSMSQGDSKSDPILGPNVARKLRSTNITDLNKAIRLNLVRDGKNVRNVDLSGGKIKVDIDE
jgi:uncharacterized protein YabE (DUF348 family)